MRLLVSVAGAADAAAALAGGADIIDAKDPTAGALGAVSLPAFRAIHAAVAEARPVSAALGDAAGERAIADAARAFAEAGARFVKVGFAGITSRARLEALIEAATRGILGARREITGSAALQGCPVAVGRPEGLRYEKPLPIWQRALEVCATTDQTGVVAVAYADAERVSSLDAWTIAEAAACAGAAGVLLDTADKRGPGVRGLVAPNALAEWVATAHEMGLLVAVAGKLTAADLPMVRDAGADIAGVRGAACEGGRAGHVSADNVRALRAAIDASGPPKGGHYVRARRSDLREQSLP